MYAQTFAVEWFVAFTIGVIARFTSMALNRCGAFLLLGLVLSLSACKTARLEELSLSDMQSVNPPVIQFDQTQRAYFTHVDVLTYNVAALPWPLRSNRTQSLKLIGEALSDIRVDGNEPDIVLIQEGFRRSTKHLIINSGYPNWVRGPKTNDKMPRYSDGAPEEFKKGSKFFKGEKIGKIMDSGLYVLSNWPILFKKTQPFYARECAGFDCGANKGVIWVEIDVPGMPGHLQMFNTHMNANGATTGVGDKRNLTAYGLQFDHMDAYVETLWSEDHPMIFGGDFNSKNAQDRLDHVSSSPSRRNEIVRLTQEFCKETSEVCKTYLNSAGETPWLDTQDWQGFSSGKTVTVTPIQIIDVKNRIVDNAPKIKGRKTLSDHGAVWVRYRLSWR